MEVLNKLRLSTKTKHLLHKMIKLLKLTEKNYLNRIIMSTLKPSWILDGSMNIEYSQSKKFLLPTHARKFWKLAPLWASQLSSWLNSCLRMEWYMQWILGRDQLMRVMTRTSLIHFMINSSPMLFTATWPTR